MGRSTRQLINSGYVYGPGIGEKKLRGKEDPRPWDLINEIVVHLPQHGKLLDVGCGTANKTVGLAKYVSELVGLDIWDNLQLAKKAADNVKESGYKNITLTRGDSRHLPFPDASFDVVTYMLAPEDAKEAFRVFFFPLVVIFSSIVFLFVAKLPRAFLSHYVESVFHRRLSLQV